MSEVTMLSALIKAGYVLCFDRNEMGWIRLGVVGNGVNRVFTVLQEQGASFLITVAYKVLK